MPYRIYIYNAEKGRSNKMISEVSQITNLKKNRPPKNAFLDTFWKMLTKKIAFFQRALSSKFVLFGTKGAHRQFLGSVSQKWESENSRKGVLLGRQQPPPP